MALGAFFLGSGASPSGASEVEAWARDIAATEARREFRALGQQDFGPAFDERVQSHMRWALPVAKEVSALTRVLAAEGYSRQEVKRALQKPSAFLVASAREGAWTGGPNKPFRGLVRNQLERGRAAKNSSAPAEATPASPRLSEEEIERETERRMRAFVVKEARAEQRAKESRSPGAEGLSEGSRWRQASDARIRAEYERVRREVEAGR